MKYRHEARGTVIQTDGTPPGPGWVPADAPRKAAPAKKTAPKKTAPKTTDSQE